MKTTVRLEELSSGNWEDVAELTVAEEQRGLIASNLYSIAQSRFLPGFVTKAVVAEGNIVGFVMYGPDPDDGEMWLYRLMIDHRFQQRGYGRAALGEAVWEVRQLAVPLLRLGVSPKNIVARALYESCGFRPTGESIDGEDILQLRIEPADTASERP